MPLDRPTNIAYTMVMHPHRFLRDLFSPSMVGSTLYALAALAILLVSNLTPIIYQVTIPENRYYFDRLFHAYSASLFNRLDQYTLTGQITSFLIWGGVGAAIYVMVWLTINWYISMRNSVVIGTTYTSIDTHGHVRYWSEIVARSMFRVCAIILILMLANIAMRVWYPLSITMFQIWLQNFTVPANWMLMLESFAGWLIVFHFMTISLRLVLLRTRVIEP